jgi:hypothetical protein
VGAILPKVSGSARAAVIASEVVKQRTFRGALDKEHHQERDDGGCGIHDQLPRALLG